MANTLVYILDEKIYINLTNRCTNDCIFCLRNDKDDVVGQTLWLDDENSTANDVIEQLVEKLKSLKIEKLDTTIQPLEIIFCGYGEPMLKFDVLKEVSEYIKKIIPKQKFVLTQTDTRIMFIKEMLYRN